MPRISGIDIPEQKRIVISLAYIRGIGDVLSRKILSQVGIDESVRAKDLTEDDIAKIRSKIDELKIPVEGELRKIVSQNIARLKDIRSFRGLRHGKSLPVRGQRTKTNARTRRGKKATVGGMKRILQKT
ncbi:MAG: 30S ribosomal protein S13 [bacterium]|nr:30S ribosomal protein S13 [bacterium]